MLYALGEKPRTMYRYAKVTRTFMEPVEGADELQPVVKEVYLLEEYQVMDPNPTAANQAIALLLREIGPEGSKVPAPGQIDDRADFRELFRQFQDKLRKEEAIKR